jgi:hypothetical protein
MSVSSRRQMIVARRSTSISVINANGDGEEIFNEHPFRRSEYLSIDAARSP